MNFLKRLWKDESGATAVEYTLIAVAVALAIVIAVNLAGVNMRDGVYTDIQGVVH
jgi:Flp pilus assembly pilin Flp